MPETQNKLIPQNLNITPKWQLSRRGFVRNLLLAGLASQYPIFSSCVNQTEGIDEIDEMIFKHFSHSQKLILKEVQIILFPADGNGPSAEDVDALKYLDWVLSDPMIDPTEVDYIINGIGWVEETAQEEHKESFIKLSQENRNNLITLIAEEDWGESWLSVILKFVLEAVLSDPQYGGNTDETGWKWLQHYPGYPRPTPELLYDKIIQTIRL